MNTFVLQSYIGYFIVRYETMEKNYTERVLESTTTSVLVCILQSGIIYATLGLPPTRNRLQKMEKRIEH